MGEAMPMFTVFTPTFNRAATLSRAYGSLQKQTLRDFEWLVIDDGSTDYTREVVQRWAAEADFPVRYVWQENGGKAAAWNHALELARGEFFVCLDSDDACVPEALATFKEIWGGIPLEERSRFSGMTALAIDQNENPYGREFPSSPLDCSHLEITYGIKHFHDSWQCYRSSVIREYPFELLEGYKNYLPETTVINRLAKIYIQRHANKRLLVVYTETHADAHEHQSCGLSSRAGLKHAPGIRVAHLSLLNHQCKWFTSAPARFYKAAANYIRFSWMQGISVGAQLKELGSLPARALWLAALPAAVALRVNDRMVERRSRS